MCVDTAICGTDTLHMLPTAPSVCPKFPRPMASEAVLDHDVITNDVIFPNTHTQLIESAQKMNSEILESVKELVTVSLPSISLSLSLSEFITNSTKQRPLTPPALSPKHSLCL